MKELVGKKNLFRLFFIAFAIMLALIAVFVTGGQSSDIIKNENNPEHNKYIDLMSQIAQAAPPLDSQVELLKGKQNLINNGRFLEGIKHWDPMGSVAFVGDVFAKLLVLNNISIEQDKTQIGKLVYPDGKPYQEMDISSESNIMIKENGKVEGIYGKGLKVHDSDIPFIVLDKGSNGRNWIYQRVAAEEGKTYILSFDVISSNLGSATVLLGEYGNTVSSRVKNIEVGPNWKRVYVIYQNNKDKPVDVVLYSQAGPLAYTNVSMYQLDESELNNLAGGFSNDKIKDIEKQLTVRNELVNAQKNEDHVKQIGKFVDQHQEQFEDLFLFKLEKWFNSSAWKNAKNDNVIQQLVKKNIEEGFVGAAPVLYQWHSGLSSRQYLLLYINYLVHGGLTEKRPEIYSPKSLKEEFENIYAECARSSAYAGTLISIVTGERPKITILTGHTVLSGDDYIMDTQNNILFLFDVSKTELILELSPEGARRVVLDNMVVGFPKQLSNLPIREKDALKPQILEGYSIPKGYMIQLNRFMDTNKFPLFIKRSTDAFLETWGKIYNELNLTEIAN
ncbi:MAG: hypothetical protein ACYCX4_04650 [Bacillota bacterium]